MIQKVVFSVLSSSSSLLLLFFFFFVATKSCCCRVSTRSVRERFGSRFFLCVVFFSFNSSKTHTKKFLSFRCFLSFVVVFLFFLFFCFFVVFTQHTHNKRAHNNFYSQKIYHISIELSQLYSIKYILEEEEEEEEKSREREDDTHTHTHTEERERKSFLDRGGRFSSSSTLRWMI